MPPGRVASAPPTLRDQPEAPAAGRLGKRGARCTGRAVTETPPNVFHRKGLKTSFKIRKSFPVEADWDRAGSLR